MTHLSRADTSDGNSASTILLSASAGAASSSSSEATSIKLRLVQRPDASACDPGAARLLLSSRRRGRAIAMATNGRHDIANGAAVETQLPARAVSPAPGCCPGAGQAKGSGRAALWAETAVRQHSAEVLARKPRWVVVTPGPRPEDRHVASLGLDFGRLGFGSASTVHSATAGLVGPLTFTTEHTAGRSRVTAYTYARHSLRRTNDCVHHDRPVSRA